MAQMHICIVSELYPTKYYSAFAFVDQLVRQLVDLGVKCTVVAPQSVTGRVINHDPLVPVYEKHYTSKGNSFDVYRPYTISVSNLRFRGTKMSLYLMRLSVEHCLSRYKLRPDLFYCHFWHSSYFVIKYARLHKIPVFVASGESKISIRDCYRPSVIERISSYVSGVICVSSKNKDESLSLQLTTEEKAIVIPNAIDSSRFYLLDRNRMREELHFSPEDFILAFVGAFVHRKGTDRVSAALSLLGNPGIKSIFIGKGPVEPDCEGILYKGTLPHDEIVKYLNCADVFVLPTLHEGCCNAILEAMACGLPIISSDKSFNDDILDSSYAFRIDPENVEEIAKAIDILYRDRDLCREMGHKAYMASRNFDIEERAKRIISYVQARM